MTFTLGRLTCVVLLAFVYLGTQAQDEWDAMLEQSESDDNDTETGSEVRKRSVGNGGLEIRTRLSRLDSAIKLTRVEFKPLRERRAVKNDTKFLWGPRVPYRVDKSYNPKLLPTLKNLLSYVNDHLCVQHIDVTAEYTDPSDLTWPSRHNFTLDAYLLVAQGPEGCVAILGRGGHLKGAQKYNPCGGWAINLHETLHTLGVVHTQRNPNRDNYIRLNNDNIEEDWRKFFKKEDARETYAQFFDGMSPMLYGKLFKSTSGLEVWFPIREDLFKLENHPSHALDSFAELNHVYKCREKYCGGEDADCDLGYFTKFKGQCQCVCPEGQDASKDCHEHITYDKSDVKWPSTPFSFFGPDCPDGFENGQLTFTTKQFKPSQTFGAGDPFKLEGRKITFDFCTKTTPSDASAIDWSGWGEGGGLCLIKPKDVACGGDFEESSVVMETGEESVATGTLGDITIEADKVTMRFCCQGNKGQAPILPPTEHFNLLAGGNCPNILGMRSARNKVILWTNGKGTGVNPFYIWPGQTHINLCYYLPSKNGKETDAPKDPWPATPAALLGPDCPTGFEKGQLAVPARTFKPRMTFNAGTPFKRDGKTLVLDLCTKTTPTDGIDWSAWGEKRGFCIMKPKGVACGGDFKDGSITLDTPEASVATGNVGDVTITPDKLTLRFCCQDKENSWTPPQVPLPSQEYFNLFAFKGCPDVPGMSTAQNKVIFWTEAEKSGLSPFSVWPGQAHMNLCHYTPQTAGCSKIYHLNEDLTSVKIMSPQAEDGREANRRCQYDFRAPEDSLMRVTFNEYDPHPDDLLYIKRDHQWQGWYKESTDAKLHQILTVKNYLSMLYWASWQDGENKGLTMTVDILSADKSCYDMAVRGKDYVGEKSITETYQECLPWAEAVSCSDFPWDDVITYDLLTPGNNKCRNPGGELLQPWCYTYVRGNTCQRKYCEVCNYVDAKDAIPSCAEREAEHPDFCTSGVGRHGCAETCKLPVEAPPKRAAKCGWPKGPEDGKAHDVVWSTNNIGDRVHYSCGSVNYTTICTETGWTKVPATCADAGSEDVIANCKIYAATYAGFCSKMPGAKNFCQKTCGGCEGEEESCSVPTSATYTSDVTSAQVGEVVQFECADGYLYVSGPLQRMCGPGGELLGSEPVCEASPKFQDVNLKHVRQRPAQLKFRQGFLLDHDGYRVPMAGEISEWYYYCGNEGRLDFVVYRKDGSGTFQYVGSNNVTCEAGFKLRHLVPAADRISVKPDDAVGVHTSGHDTLSINACKGSIKLVEPLIASPQKTVDVTKLDFAKRGCLYPSVGFRVES